VESTPAPAEVAPAVEPAVAPAVAPPPALPSAATASSDSAPASGAVGAIEPEAKPLNGTPQPTSPGKRVPPPSGAAVTNDMPPPATTTGHKRKRKREEKDEDRGAGAPERPAPVEPEVDASSSSSEEDEEEDEEASGSSSSSDEEEVAVVAPVSVKLCKLGELCCEAIARFVGGNPQPEQLAETLGIDQRVKLDHCKDHIQWAGERLTVWRFSAVGRKGRAALGALGDYFVAKQRIGLVETASYALYIVPPDEGYLEALGMPPSGYALGLQVPLTVPGEVQ